jgi:2-C-methyl-D-erythritol 2,4-cyclodiphosphate synthase
MQSINFRVGTGYDVHQLVPNRKLIIGGVTIPYEKGLMGHSDADVLCHAVCDALLGAAALGDIGMHFPDTDSKYKNISSLKLLIECVQKIQLLDYVVGNIDCIIIAQSPRMSPYIQEMKNKLHAAMELSREQINIKATTTEKLGFIGTGEGIAAQCVALIGMN